MNYTKNFKAGDYVTIKGLGYNGKVLEYDVNGVMVIQWNKWNNDSYKSPEFSDKDMILVTPKYPSKYNTPVVDSLVLEARKWNKMKRDAIKFVEDLIIGENSKEDVYWWNC